MTIYYSPTNINSNTNSYYHSLKIHYFATFHIMFISLEKLKVMQQ